MDVSPLNLGMIAAYYYINYTTIGKILLLALLSLIVRSHNCFFLQSGLLCNKIIWKTSASVSSGFPNTRKQMKARGRRPSAFIVFECLETPMKHEARVIEIASQSKLKSRSRKRNKIVKIYAN